MWIMWISLEVNREKIPVIYIDLVYLYATYLPYPSIYFNNIIVIIHPNISNILPVLTLQDLKNTHYHLLPGHVP